MNLHSTSSGLTLVCFFLSIPLSFISQSWDTSPVGTYSEAASVRKAFSSASWTSGLELRNVGPSVMGGRVVDLAVVADTMYVAYATGGLWKSINHGTTFEPLLEQTCMLGAVDAHPSGRVLVGSGEVNSSRSSYAGDGVYISDNHGATWRHAGLEGSHHIGRVIIDNMNPDRMWVAALGELYSDNFGGAIYRTEDGGQNWESVLTVPTSTKKKVVGFVDMVADDTDPNHLFAASWDRTRRAHDFTEGGTGSGIWESTDGGDNWSRISSDSNFPEGADAGRIGLSYHSATQTLFALLDNQAAPADQPDENTEEGALKALDFLEMNEESFGLLDNSKLQEFLDREGFDQADSAASVKARISAGSLEPRALHDYLTDGNRALFEAEIVGPELYRYRVPQRSISNEKATPAAVNLLAQGQSASEADEGKWVKTHAKPLEDVCYTYGYYFGTVSVDPSNASVIYIAGVPLLKSTDGGANFTSVGAANVHVDHHKLWVDPANPNHLINGNDGGINVSWDGGANWIKCNSPSVGQFYAVEVDEANPYRIYGGLQDNGTWVGDNDHRESPAWHQTGHHGFTAIGGGDGMQIEVDCRNNDVVYTGSQFGWYMRTNRTTGDRTTLHPSHKLGETPLRWNWQTPIVLSKHQQDVLYMASNKVHRSLNQGDSFETISADLTRGGLPGNVPFGTLTTLAEHPKQFGVLAVGSDDGLIHVSPDGGHSWERLKLPIDTQIGKGEDLKHLWVSEVAWSQHDPELLVVALNGYRHDCFESLVFATRDEGKSWENWGQHMPQEPVNAIVETASRKGWWIVGTDGGAYLTTDLGASFASLHRHLPRVPVHDLAIQEQKNDLIVGTHGRGIYVLDISPIIEKSGSPEEWSETPLAFEKEELEQERQPWWDKIGRGWSEPQNPVVRAWVWSRTEENARLELRFIPTAPQAPDSSATAGGGASAILDQLQKSSGFVVDAGTVDLVAGLQPLEIPMKRGEDFLEPGTYTVLLVTQPAEGEVRHEATTKLILHAAD